MPACAIQNRMAARHGTKPKKWPLMKHDQPGLNVVRPARWEHAPARPSDRAVDTPNGGPDEPDLQARVARLEPKIDAITLVLARLEPALTKLRDDNAEMTSKLSQVPNIWELSTLMVAMFGLAFVLLRYGLPTL